MRPNFDLLRKLYNFITNEVPHNQFNLDYITRGAAACAMGWAGRLPAFQARGVQVSPFNGDLILNTPSWPLVRGYLNVAVVLFDITYDEAMTLFGGVKYDDMSFAYARFAYAHCPDKAPLQSSHKALWCERMRRFFERYGERLDGIIQHSEPCCEQVFMQREQVFMQRVRAEATWQHTEPQSRPTRRASVRHAETEDAPV